MAIRVRYTFRFYLGLDSDSGAELPRKTNIFRNSRIRALLWSLALRCRSKRERSPFLRDMQSPYSSCRFNRACADVPYQQRMRRRTYQILSWKVSDRNEEDGPRMNRELSRTQPSSYASG